MGLKHRGIKFVGMSYNQIAFALEILKLLAEKPRYRNELGDLLTEYLEQQKKSGGDLNQKITRTIRKLRECDFEINSKPNRPYELIESNFPLILSQQQKEALYLAVQLLSNLGFVTQAQLLGKLYEFSEEYQSSDLKFDFNPPVDYSSKKISTIIDQLEEKIEKRCRYTIRYCSGSTGKEHNYDLDCSELRLHNGVLYLFAFVPDWKSIHFKKMHNIEQNILFNIDRIQKIGASSHTSWFYDFPTLKIKYRMMSSLANYQPRRSYEKVIERNLKEKYVDIETEEDCLFWFRQRILQYGSNVIVLDPEWLQKEIKIELEKAFKNYND